ncbi:PREDICTED: serine protease 53 [Nanorana parkeri]|uniref:serine protease 53 n=1 Tax=Nanorana parkeri TaxID=125878 RepID=UPI00085488E8|nr:PREDICTED: serine protease 53 [Nanorana parkeri]
MAPSANKGHLSGSLLQAVTAATSRACGKQGLQSRIFGGTSVVPGEFPWHATLTYKGSPFCGGSLISDRWIVTASHCFDRTTTQDKRDPKLWQVHLGFTKMGYTPNESSVVTMVPSRIVIHENYTKYTEGFDIALVELPAPVTFTRFISPICLPENSHRFHLRRTCYATGLKNVQEGVPLNSKRSLEKVGQILIGWRTCNCIYNTHMRPDLSNPANPSMLCITESDGKKGPCQGDSGGAVVCEEDGVWFLAGLVSFSQGCHLLNSPTILSSASFYQDWIKRHTDEQASFSPQTIPVVDDVDNDNCSDLLSNHTAGCGISQVSDPTFRSPGTWPWQVDLWRDGKRTCSGALISASWVITAAECFIGQGSSELPEDWSVTVGSGTPVMMDIAVQQISVHGSYISPEKGYNVALVLLAHPVPLGPYSQAVCLPHSSHRMPYGSTCWHIVGDNSLPEDQTGVPRGDKLELLGPNQCNCIYSRPNSDNPTESVIEGMICASREGENSSQCLNDLGGALVCKENGTWFLNGVYNYGGGCKEGSGSTLPRVFTQLATYDDWIDKETREMFLRPAINSPPPKPDTDRCSLDSPRDCGESVASPGPEPVGEAADKMWLWQVSLQQFESHVCSGVLITETWILTAAHCVPSRAPLSDYTVILGRSLQNQPSPREVLRQIKKVVPHPDYKLKTGENDIALVEMNYGVTFSDHILPICLASNQSISTTNDCWVIGWGRLHPSGKASSPPPLRHLRVHLLDGKDCGGSVGNMTQTGGTGQICVAAKSTTFSCLLDGSAPLVCQPNPKGPWFVFGVGSQTSPPKRNACPSNFTSVVPILSWIRGVVPKKDLSLLERNPTVPTFGYNDTVASPTTTTVTPTPPNTTLGPQSTNTTYRDSDVSTTDVHNFTTTSTPHTTSTNTTSTHTTSTNTTSTHTTSTQSSCLESTSGSGNICSEHTTVTPQTQNSTSSISMPTQQTDLTVNPTGNSTVNSMGNPTGNPSRNSTGNPTGNPTNENISDVYKSQKKVKTHRMLESSSHFLSGGIIVTQDRKISLFVINEICERVSGGEKVSKRSFKSSSSGRATKPGGLRSGLARRIRGGNLRPRRDFGHSTQRETGKSRTFHQLFLTTLTP